MSVAISVESNEISQKQTAVSLPSLLCQQQAAYQQNPLTSYEQRVKQLRQLKAALLKHQQPLIDALNQDYGQRPAHDTLVADILPCVMNINYTLKKLKKWMKPQRRHAGLLLAPASVSVEYQPLGVIGIMVPWNFPVMLSVGPLITAIAAGNHAMIKLSEFTPHTNKVLTTLLGEVFTVDQVAVVEGEADIAAKFSQLAFDHLIFTGSTAVGKHVMRAAADNLTPVTLELGGKSPVIIAPDMPIATAVERLIFGKSLNAGQICVAPDYIFCPENKVEEFVTQYKQQFQKMYGKKTLSNDFANVINAAQHQRLISWLEDAQQKGANITSAIDAPLDKESRHMPTQLVTDVSEDMLIMQQEIFGPILPIVSYTSLDSCVEYINDKPRPLALYIMSFDHLTQQHILAHTHSGGVCINDSVFHVAADDAPFGGIGESGMGHYHGHEGFLTFSKAKTVLKRGKLNTGKLVHPPYGGWIQRLMLKIFMR
ncbi:coniferyl aldehyde dehydrogenase [Psychrobium sp. 1_MG-2023]|uniref:coniferyl aldehyde dehydrogenase n=1 Tax=Psychrobium sp. 1_MG-2023 TaxID=3062624 RepID=UPI000C31FC73|nr:coniferyl aldehyde dehydrogenase [Psychrobium sp. 1_MG-2023]MDP2562324.1 coniferyl aldehyde dehydrogenase [Psychrobium sp. 1_MG-2023]PKF58066.1 coniferyl-aldehyde dehydrogenase [Alteromonadales bacterium alter-6D02]